MRISRRTGRLLSAGAGACLLLPGLAGVASAATGQVAPGQVATPGYTSQLNAVACSPGGQCWAVGSYTTYKNVSHNEILSWDGSQWRWITVPQPRAWSTLNGVSCVSARDCLAVGLTTNARGKDGQAEVLRWDGVRWSVATAPAGLIGLGVISCASSGFCWALHGTLAVPWNGQQWGTPVHFSEYAAPSSLSCLSATDCWGAGYYVQPNGIDLYNLIVHWNGQAWSRVKEPQPTGGANKLNAVSCTSASDCWAGGSDTTAAGRTKNELLHWDGSAWSLASAPRGPRVNSEVLALACASPGNCWATGDAEGGTEALHWNGSLWSLTSTPDPGGAGFLYAVGCRAAQDCIAAGFSHVPPVQNLALHWNGTAWTTL